MADDYCTHPAAAEPIIVDLMPCLPFRRSCRGLLVDGNQVLLAEHRTGNGGSVWVGPGGGVECGSPEIVEVSLSRFRLLSQFPDLVVNG